MEASGRKTIQTVSKASGQVYTTAMQDVQHELTPTLSKLRSCSGSCLPSSLERTSSNSWKTKALKDLMIWSICPWTSVESLAWDTVSSTLKRSGMLTEHGRFLTVSAVGTPQSKQLVKLCGATPTKDWRR